ncbi:MAG: GMC family oxidoreductase [Agarilytica sp.]
MKKISPFDKLISLEQAAETQWDVIIVGAGMGGGATAFSLSAKGFKVLLVEKGHANFDESAAQSVVVEERDEQKRLQGGRWPQQVTGTVNDKDIELWAPLGCGVGGSTLLYAAALQRLKPEDFAQQTLPDGSNICWPYTYQEIQPYYQQCEKLFSVKGTPDPLDQNETLDLLPPPAMCERDRSFFQSFKQSGLHPYRLHVALDYKQSCAECGGKICQADCKKDAFNALIAPALKTGHLYILDRCEIEKIEASKQSVEGLIAKQQGNVKQLKAKTYVLAAGGYFTPAILKKSADNNWPHGCGNSNGLIGKNLMFHTSDFIAFWPEQKNASNFGPNKTIALRNFYSLDGKKYGEFQSTGLPAGYGNILFSLRMLFDQSPFRKLPLVRQLLRIPAKIAAKILGEATIFTTIVEDFPKPENRIEINTSAPSGIQFFYHIDEDLKQRTQMLSKFIRRATKKLRSMPLSIGINPNWGHPCGTCKAGTDPSTSVVDENCKFHDLDNLYVSDSSFMPTSGGTNPSLTIAANALRVGDKIAEHLQRKH